MENSFSYQPAAGRYERMPYKYCGKSGLQLPLVSLGLWHNFGSVDNFDVATDMIKYAFDHGVTHFDLANNYGPLPGSAEINFGRILRENFFFGLSIGYMIHCVVKFFPGNFQFSQKGFSLFSEFIVLAGRSLGRFHPLIT